MMETKIDATLKEHNISYLELLRELAIDCDQFLLFAREKNWGNDLSQWPAICGTVFSSVPILTPFGTCFTSNSNFKIE